MTCVQTQARVTLQPDIMTGHDPQNLSSDKAPARYIIISPIYALLHFEESHVVRKSCLSLYKPQPSSLFREPIQAINSKVSKVSQFKGS